jgi:hypothetical protein
MTKATGSQKFAHATGFARVDSRFSPHSQKPVAQTTTPLVEPAAAKNFAALLNRLYFAATRAYGAKMW